MQKPLRAIEMCLYSRTQKAAITASTFLRAREPMPPNHRKPKKRPPSKERARQHAKAVQRAEKETGPLIDKRLTKALSHPLRVQILSEVKKRPLSPSRYSEEFDVALGTASYHFRILMENDCIELVNERKVRGAIEHIYRATRLAFINDVDWEAFGEAAKSGVSSVVLDDYLTQCLFALEGGTFLVRRDSVWYWVNLQLDEKGWGRVTSAAKEFIDVVADAEAESVNRASSDGTPLIPSTFSVALFENPPATDTSRKPKSKRKL